jgi:hypothetical protein
MNVKLSGLSDRKKIKKLLTDILFGSQQNKKDADHTGSSSRIDGYS